MAIDGTLEVVNAYNIRQLKLAARASSAAVQQKPGATSVDAQSAFFPDNNTVEWSTSLAPGETPTPLDVSNESQENNQRVLFYAVGRLVPRLTATLYIRAGQKALVHLPLGHYRVDVASSPVTMSWEKAQAIVAIARDAFGLPADDQQNVPRNRLIVSAEGKVSFLRVSPIVIKNVEKSGGQPDTF